MASSSVVPTGAVTRPSEVISSVTGTSMRSVKRRSRLVMMPTSRPSGAVTGTPEMWNFSMTAMASPTVASGPMTTGSTIMPDSERFTRSTSAAWSSMERLRWMTPMPPWRAMAMARRASVTVSIAAETSGMATEMVRVNRLVVSASDGMTSDAAGRSSTSS
jgi:hypothetical protein